MAKYLTDRLNAVFVETALARRVALDTACKAGLRRSDALAGAIHAAQQAVFLQQLGGAAAQQAVRQRDNAVPPADNDPR